MSFDADFERMVNRTIRHPEHHKLRRKRFHTSFYEFNRERFAPRQSFGHRETPPPPQQPQA